MYTGVFEEYTASIFMVEEISSTLKMEASRSSEMFIDIYQTTWRHIQKTVIFTVTAVRTSKPKNGFFH
jgi:hypothetical protein